jgi:hypothetical protein
VTARLRPARGAFGPVGPPVNGGTNLMLGAPLDLAPLRGYKSWVLGTGYCVYGVPSPLRELGETGLRGNLGGSDRMDLTRVMPRQGTRSWLPTKGA